MRTLRWGGVALAVMFAVQGPGAAFGQAISGDVDGNHEVSLSDVSGFVGCLSGPDAPSIDPLCVAAMFDEDDDVDLRDVAGFQNRFGFGVGPPRIGRFWPLPGEWIVDDAGLTEVRIGFTEPVTMPDDAVTIWGVASGTFTDFTTSYDDQAMMLTVAFGTLLREDRVTVIVDYSIEDLAGNPLDGEIYNPLQAVLPSGNGVNGGQGVFRVHVLQGDANRDGAVDDSDLALINASLGLCDRDPGFDPLSDLNADGCVDATDENIVTATLGNQLPATDGTPPIVVAIREPTADQQDFDTVVVDFDEPIPFSHLTERTCFLVAGDGSIVVPSSVGSPPFGTSAVYTLPSALTRCDTFRVNVSNAIADFSGELLEMPEPLSCP